VFFYCCCSFVKVDLCHLQAVSGPVYEPLDIHLPFSTMVNAASG
jgi:hypothetical protein